TDVRGIRYHTRKHRRVRRSGRVHRGLIGQAGWPLVRYFGRCAGSRPVACVYGVTNPREPILREPNRNCSVWTVILQHWEYRRKVKYTADRHAFCGETGTASDSCAKWVEIGPSP